MPDKFLYFNGDSFVKGVELGDDLIPEHPGYFTSLEAITKPAKLWMKNTYDMNHTYGKYRQNNLTQIYQSEHEKSFATKVHKFSNISFLNKALGGSSLDRIVRTSISDLHYIKKNNSQQVYAFIGTTDIFRSELPSEDSDGVDLYGFNNDWHSIATRYSTDNEPNLLKSVREYKVRYEKNYHALVKFYLNVILLQDFCYKNDIKLFWVQSNEDILTDIIVESNYETRPELLWLKEYANFQYLLSMKHSALELCNEPAYCVSGHYSEIVHDHMAQKIINILEK